MALAERASLSVLPGHAHRYSTLNEAGEGERLGLRPVDLAVFQGPPPSLDLLDQLWMNRESVRVTDQLPVDRLEGFGRDGRLDVGLRGLVHLSAYDFRSTRFARLHVVVGLGESLVDCLESL